MLIHFHHKGDVFISLLKSGVGCADRIVVFMMNAGIDAWQMLFAQSSYKYAMMESICEEGMQVPKATKGCIT